MSPKRLNSSSLVKPCARGTVIMNPSVTRQPTFHAFPPNILSQTKTPREKFSSLARNDKLCTHISPNTKKDNDHCLHIQPHLSYCDPQHTRHSRQGSNPSSSVAIATFIHSGNHLRWHGSNLAGHYL